MSANPSGPVGLPLDLDPRRVGTEPARFGVPGSMASTGFLDLVTARLAGIRINVPNLGYPDGVGTKPECARSVTETVYLTFLDDVTLTVRVRGVFERIGYDPAVGTFMGNGRVVINGQNDTTAHSMGVVGEDGTYSVNHKAGSEVINAIESADFTFDLPVSAGTESLQFFSIIPGGEFSTPRQRDNVSEAVVGPVGLSPYPSVYAGQFVQFDVIAAVYA